MKYNINVGTVFFYDMSLPINGGIHLDNLNNMAVMLLCTGL